MKRAIVIGGGILGTAAAMRLGERGVSVTLLEAASLGAGASRATFGWVNASNKTPQAYFHLNVDGMNEYRRMQREFGDPPWMRFDGHLEWDTRERGADRIREKITRLRSWGYTAEILSPADARLLEPDLVLPETVEEVAWYPQEGTMDAAMMVGAFAARARAHNVLLRTGTRVSRLLAGGSRVTGVELASGEHLHADVVVSATGSASPGLLGDAGFELPMAPTVGMVAVTGPSIAQLRSVVHDGTIDLRPDSAGRVMMRHDDFDAMVDDGTLEMPIPAFVDDLMARAVAVVPAVTASRVEAIRVTTRPIPGDGKPVAGFVPGVEGLYVMVMHSGVTIGPLVARLAAREIVDGIAETRLAPFRPGREIHPSTSIKEN
jgi:glycine/D-amino acid oxidase-like deaminating enzyme